MKKHILVLGLCLGLGACVSTQAPPVTGTPVVVPTSKVVNALRQACGLRIAAQTIAALVRTYVGYAGTADQLAWDIARGACNAVEESYASSAPVVFRGIVIRS